MKNQKIRERWDLFMQEHNELFVSNEEIWIDRLNMVEDYIISNNKRPPSKSKDNEVQILGSWKLYTNSI